MHSEDQPLDDYSHVSSKKDNVIFRVIDNEELIKFIFVKMENSINFSFILK